MNRAIESANVQICTDIPFSRGGHQWRSWHRWRAQLRHRWLQPISLCMLVLIGANANAEQWEYHHGKGYVVCDAIRKRLNSFQWTEDLVMDESGFYLWSVVASFPGWKEPPWEDLDPQQHQALVRKLLAYNFVLGPDVYYGRKPNPYGDSYEGQVDEIFRKSYRSGLKLRVWRTHLLEWYSDDADGKAPAGLQTIVQIEVPWAPAELERLHKKRPDLPAVARAGSVFVVTDDLSDPEPRVDNWTATSISPVFLYGNRPYMPIASALTVEIYRVPKDQPVDGFCELEFKLTK